MSNPVRLRGEVGEAMERPDALGFPCPICGDGPAKTHCSRVHGRFPSETADADRAALRRDFPKGCEVKPTAKFKRAFPSSYMGERYVSGYSMCGRYIYVRKPWVAGNGERYVPSFWQRTYVKPKALGAASHE